MRERIVLTALLLSLALFAGSQAWSARPAGQQPAQQAAERTEVTPFYCNLRGLTPEQRKRKAELDQTLRSARTAARELSDGVEFQFPAEASSIRTVAEWAVMERVCCPFFDIERRLEREGGPFWLRLTGREGVKKFISSEFGAEWFR
jgi:hypothetical protein